MIADFGSALSGLAAATKRVALAAGNIVHARSQAAPSDEGQGFVALRVEQASQPLPGGTHAIARPLAPPAVPVFEPRSPDSDAIGIASRPNITLENEFSTLRQARTAYESSLRVIEVQSRMLREFIGRRV